VIGTGIGIDLKEQISIDFNTIPIKIIGQGIKHIGDKMGQIRNTIEMHTGVIVEGIIIKIGSILISHIIHLHNRH